MHRRLPEKEGLQGQGTHQRQIVQGPLQEERLRGAAGGRAQDELRVLQVQGRKVREVPEEERSETFQERRGEAGPRAPQVYDLRMRVEQGRQRGLEHPLRRQERPVGRGKTRLPEQNFFGCILRCTEPE